MSHTPPTRPRRRVAAVVLTHNRKALLAECLEGIFAQSLPVERAHVIDNASNDGTRQLLEERGLVARGELAYHRLEHNVGGAGGFSHGVGVARDEDVDWLWLMDDDAEPRPDSLERLLESSAAEEPSTVALCSRVEGPDGTLQGLHRGFIARRPRALPESAYTEEAPRVGYATFVGLLIRTEAARQLELPRPEFFLWADDYEYSMRLRQLGEIRLVPSSVIVHKEARNSYVTRRGRLANRLLGWDLASTRYEAAWPNFFGLRNYVWMRQRHENQSLLGAAGTLSQFVLKALLYDEKPLQRIPWLVRFAIHGRRGVFVNDLAEDWPRRIRSRRAPPLASDEGRLPRE